MVPTTVLWNWHRPKLEVERNLLNRSENAMLSGLCLLYAPKVGIQLDCLTRMIQNGIIDVGQPGDLVAKFLLIQSHQLLEGMGYTVDLCQRISVAR
jgi:hypothetical protein